MLWMCLYVLVLACAPCADAAPVAGYTTQFTTEAAHAHPDSDHCSPLCACNCCAIGAFFVAQSAWAPMPLASPILQTAHATLWPRPLGGWHRAVRQPPRTGNRAQAA